MSVSSVSVSEFGVYYGSSHHKLIYILLFDVRRTAKFLLTIRQHYFLKSTYYSESVCSARYAIYVVIKWLHIGKFAPVTEHSFLMEALNLNSEKTSFTFSAVRVSSGVRYCSVLRT